MSEFTNKFKKMRYFKILILTSFIINFSCDFQKNNQITESEISSRADKILNTMTLEEKVGQMTQIDQRFLDTITDLSTYHIGSLLSGGGSHPDVNEPQAWLDMYNKYQSEALKSRLAIPLVYGIDAVHGHNNVYGATIFPHNIGLGATNNSDLIYKVSEITSKEVAATGIDWTFAPCLSSPEDYRWGRTYEGFSSDPSLVANLGSAAVSGYQSVANMNGKKVIACAKHFVGDGNTEFGTGMNGLVDRGNTVLSIDELKEKLLPKYQQAIDADVQTIMASYNSWNGVKCHGSKELLTDILKDEMGFEGFVISDWQGIDEIPGDYKSDIINSVNAGIDMIMVPGAVIWGGEHYKTFLSLFKEAVDEGLITEERLNDAVRRILRIKYRSGLMNNPMSDRTLIEKAGSIEHKDLAREAVQKSLVLLKNDGLLPLDESKTYFVTGSGADDIGKQCGGWTIQWQGGLGDITPGTSIIEGVEEFASTNRTSENQKFDAAIVVVGEDPYTEMEGDSDKLFLSEKDKKSIEDVKKMGVPYVVVLITGRPLIVNETIDDSNAFLVAWLPGTEGGGVADILFGKENLTGTLSFSWPKSMEDIPCNYDNDCDALFPLGFGLTYSKK